jgi:hypothetical protein
MGCLCSKYSTPVEYSDLRSCFYGPDYEYVTLKACEWLSSIYYNIHLESRIVAEPQGILTYSNIPPYNYIRTAITYKTEQTPYFKCVYTYICMYKIKFIDDNGVKKFVRIAIFKNTINEEFKVFVCKYYSCYNPVKSELKLYELPADFSRYIELHNQQNPQCTFNIILKNIKQTHQQTQLHQLQNMINISSI